MMNNMNKGYTGFSMSNRAVAAYQSGKAPKSKWTKSKIVDAINGFMIEYDKMPTTDFGKMKKDELFEEFMHITEWHHTGSYCNRTYFYALDEDACGKHSRELTDEEFEERMNFFDEEEADDRRKSRAMYKEAKRLYAIFNPLKQQFEEKVKELTGIENLNFGSYLAYALCTNKYEVRIIEYPDCQCKIYEIKTTNTVGWKSLSDSAYEGLTYGAKDGIKRANKFFKLLEDGKLNKRQQQLIDYYKESKN